MNKKIIAIIAVTIVAIAGIAAVTYIIKNDTNRASRDGDIPYVNKNRHIGVIKVVPKDVIKEAFGSGAIVSDAHESGTLEMDSFKSETASYTVRVPKGKVTVQIDARTFSSKEALSDANVFVGAEQAEVGDLGDEAHYLVPAEQLNTGEHQVALLAVKDKTSYKFAIQQRANAVVYGVDDAKKILRDIAEQSKLDAVK